jgi:hypothetical protein
MSKQSPVNPFYMTLVPVAVLFVLTACAYGVMTWQSLNLPQTEDTGLTRVMAQHGLAIMLAELALLAVLTVAAISTDGFGTRRGQYGGGRPQLPTAGPSAPILTEENRHGRRPSGTYE